MRAQVSIEFLIIIGLGLGIISLFLLYSYNSFYAYKTNTDIAQVRDSMEKIAKTAEFVHLQGSPAKQKINVCFPLSIDNCSVSGYALSCYMNDGKEVFYDSRVNLSGEPISSGCWDLVLESQETSVDITVS